MTATKVTPLGEQRNRLIQNTGDDHWIYGGVPVRDTVIHRAPDGAVRRIQCYFFEWKCIPGNIQQAMARSRASVHGLSFEMALWQLARMPIAIPVDDLTLEELR